MEKTRLDILVETRGLAHSRSAAQRLIMAGSVRVNGQVFLKASEKVLSTDIIEVTAPPRYVSRGGEKLEAALSAFDLDDLKGKVCVDVGASTGGFTDCLLQHGAAKVYAVDVGYGVLDWKMRNDPRVVVMERTNARHVTGFDDLIQLVTIDASFISLGVLLPVIRKWFSEDAEVIALIKPQFEAGRSESARGKGVIRDPLVHHQVLTRVLANCNQEGFQIHGLIRSPLTGPKGNIEFLVHLKIPQPGIDDLEPLVETVLTPINDLSSQ